MRVYHICESFDESYGGPARSVPLLADLSAAQGLKISFISTDNFDARNSFIERNQYTWRKLKYFGPRKVRLSWRFTLALIYIALRKENKVFHVHNSWNYVPFIVFLIAKISRTKFVVSSRGAYSQWSLAQGYVRKKIARYIFQAVMLRSAFSVHVTSRAEEEEVRSFAPKASIVLIANPVPTLVGYSKLVPDSFELRSNTKFLFLSRIHKKKGIDKLLAAWCELFPTQDCRLTIAGNFSDNYPKAEFKKMIKGRSDIEYVGYADEETKAKLLSETDFFILPTESENFGIVIGEAMSLGVPVLTTKNTPFTEIVSNGAGIIIEHNSKEGIKQAIVSAKNIGGDDYLRMCDLAIDAANNLAVTPQDVPWSKLYGIT